MVRLELSWAKKVKKLRLGSLQGEYLQMSKMEASVTGAQSDFKH